MSLDITQLLFGLLKILFILGGFLYVIFSIIIIRQIHIMQKSVQTSLSIHLQLASYVHLVLAMLAELYFILAL